MGSSRKRPSRKHGRARLTTFAVLAAVIISFGSTGCSGQDTESEPQEQQVREEVAAIDVPEVDSVEVIDDERNLERRIEDVAIATRVRMALVDARDLRRFDFDPLVVNGEVRLRGEVDTRDQRSRAEAIASEVSGVRRVSNQVTALEQPDLASERSGSERADTSGQPADASADGDTAETPEDQATATAESSSDDSQDEGEAQQDEQEATYHTVRSGESLWTISRSYGVSIDQIRRLNNLQSNSLRPGQRLQVK